MNKQRIEQVEEAIARVQRRIAELRFAEAHTADWRTNPKETGALRRASMELTRALADMRNAAVRR